MGTGAKRGALFALTGGAFLFSMQQSLIVPALTTLQRELNTSATMATWLVTGLVIAGAVSTPIFGRLGDLFGRSRVLVASLALLCLGTLICALSRSVGMLLIGRIVQGLSAGVTSLTFSVVGDVLPRQQIARGVGLIAAMMSIGAATGIVLSGPISTTLGYQWLFWLPLMAMVPITVFTATVVPSSRGAPGVRVDWKGALLLALWLSLLLIAVSQGPSQGWSSGRVVGCFAAAGVGLAAWLATESRVDSPLINLTLLRHPILWRAHASAFGAGFAMQSTFTFVPRLVQTPESTGYGLGIAASRAGLVTLLWSIGSTVAGFLSGRFVVRRDHRSVMLLGASCSVAGYVLVVLHHRSFVVLMIELGLFGFGVGLFTAIIPMILMHQVGEGDAGVTTALNQVVRMVGSAVGTQLVATILASNVRSDGFPRATMYTASFIVILGACVLMLLAASALPRRGVLGHKGPTALADVVP